MSFSNTACTQAQALLTEQSMALPSDDFLFSPNDETLLLQHLASCADCRNYQNSMKHLTDSLRDLDAVPVPEGLMDRIMQTIEQEEVVKQSPASTQRMTKKHFWLRPAMAMAATMLLLVLALPMLQQNEKETVTNHTIATVQPAEPLPSKQVIPPSKPTLESPAQPLSEKAVSSAPAASAKTAARPTRTVDTSQIASARVDTEFASEEDLTFTPTDPEGYTDPVGNLVGF
jgi:negative regulator of sigma E activity